MSDEATATPLYQVVGHLPPGSLTALEPDALPRAPAGTLIDLLGIRATHAGPGACRAEMRIGTAHLNQRGLVHGGAVVAFADATAGWAAYAALPGGRFTTMDLTCSYVSATRDGDLIVAIASPLHVGRRSLLIDVRVLRAEDESAGRPLVARVSCRQLVLS